jgi:uncharacterized protein YgiM (DUF1202 family)
MRTATAFFGALLLVAALGIGWWSPIERTEPIEVGAIRPSAPEPEPEPSEVEPEPAAPISAEPVPEEPVETAEPELQADIFTTTANVRLRSGPSSNFGIVWTAPAGTRVRSLQVDGNWHFVTTAEYEGWIYNRYLSAQTR